MSSMFIFNSNKGRIFGTAPPCTSPTSVQRPYSLPERRVGRPVGGDLLLVGVAHGQQHFLGVVQVAALFAVILELARLDDGVHRAGLLAEAAENALGQVDVVARGAAGAVGAHL